MPVMVMNQALNVKWAALLAWFCHSKTSFELERKNKDPPILPCECRKGIANCYTF